MPITSKIFYTFSDSVVLTRYYKVPKNRKQNQRKIARLLSDRDMVDFR